MGGDASYDILDYVASGFELRYDDPTLDKEKFMFFFAIRLGTESISYLDELLDFQWKYNFKQDTTQYTRFLKQICGTYKKQLISKVRCAAIKRWYTDLAISIPLTTTDTILTPVTVEESNSSEHKNTKPKLSIPITVERTNIDKLTKLTCEETALLFTYLQQAELVLADQADLLSQQSFAKAIQVLTGYSANSTVVALQKTQASQGHKGKIKKVLQKIIKLIDNELYPKSTPN
jgi:hypothetical protein